MSTDTTHRMVYSETYTGNSYLYFVLFFTISFVSVSYGSNKVQIIFDFVCPLAL